jgi:GNAT superfamily N-acetyltransferase
VKPQSKSTIIDELSFRFFSDNDSIDELTQLLNVAYRKYLSIGLEFMAANQDSTKTLDRLKGAKCLIATHHNRIVATIAYYSPANTNGNPWYDKEGVASYGQFAVDSAYQNLGIGDLLISKMEEFARADKAAVITIDTAKDASDLVNYYTRRGYRDVGTWKWDVTNFISVMLQKNLINDEIN